MALKRLPRLPLPQRSRRHVWSPLVSSQASCFRLAAPILPRLRVGRVSGGQSSTSKPTTSGLGRAGRFLAALLRKAARQLSSGGRPPYPEISRTPAPHPPGRTLFPRHHPFPVIGSPPPASHRRSAPSRPQPHTSADANSTIPIDLQPPSPHRPGKAISQQSRPSHAQQESESKQIGCGPTTYRRYLHPIDESPR